ncbi:unnamed protein product [Moneuplotes crassus]|uniref:C2H2-type domain-containing protein n=1 Tax=Euplotes crassus TaxID=5936 RepID=A0AAD1YAX4_EUPCR|nr:unnamed protein product [Moneuplotes crassus]
METQQLKYLQLLNSAMLGSQTDLLYQSTLMNLSLALSIQPWFLNLVNCMKKSMEICQELEFIQKNTGDVVSLQKLLKDLGYCGCPTPSSLLDQVNKTRAEDKAETDESQKNSLTHDSGSQSGGLNLHKNASSDSPISNSGVSGEDSILNFNKHRKGDEYLLKVHPNEVKFITNPKTGRKVKKIFCKAPGCSRSFDKKWNFKDHIRMHMGEKPYKCNKCDKAFTQKGNLAKHLRQHQFKDLKSRKVHQCPICFKKFTEKYNLKSHMRACKIRTAKSENKAVLS